MISLVRLARLPGVNPCYSRTYPQVSVIARVAFVNNTHLKFRVLEALGTFPRLRSLNRYAEPPYHNGGMCRTPRRHRWICRDDILDSISNVASGGHARIAGSRHH